MTAEPFLFATLTLQIHICAATLALVLGPVALWRKRRDRLHKVVGYVWVTGMATTALSSFLIPSTFSPVGIGPIHALSVYGLWGLYVAMRAIYRRDIKLHKEVMENVYVRGLALAGAVNFLPGRTIQKSLLPDAPMLGYVIIALVFAWAFLPARIRQRWSPPMQRT
jgi:uncharacterized membrane protein